MARPSRCRRVCAEPVYHSFAPCGQENPGTIVLTVDEYEVVRLVDYEKKTHDLCARQMGISRSTVTGIYERARFKIADCIVNGKCLRIMGGNYRLCDNPMRQCGKCMKHIKKTGLRKGENLVKIAVTYDNGQIFQHFGHTSQFKVYEVENGVISSSSVVDTNGSGHGALAGFLSDMNVDVLICGGIGAGAQNALAEAGIQLFGGVYGDANESVKAFLEDRLEYDANVHCDHHGHEHGEHGNCGADKHGCAGSGCHG